MLFRSRRIRFTASAVALVLAGCGAPVASPNDAAEVAPKDTDAPDASMLGTSESGWIERNAALDRVTLDEWVDATAEVDMAAIGGFDLLDAAPPVRQSFCAAASEARIAWLKGPAIALQYWFDAYSAVDDTPPHVAADLTSLREHAAQRIAWNFRRAHEPIVDDDVATAAHRIVSEAALECGDFPLLVGREAIESWVEGSIDGDDPVRACDRDRSEVAAALDRYTELTSEPASHLEQVEARLLADTKVFFLGSELHRLDSDGASITPLAGSACDTD